MKHALLPALLLGSALLAGGAWSQERAQNGDLEARVAALEAQLAETRRSSEALAAEQATLRAADAQVFAYLARQATAAEAMEKVLDVAETKGFTAGINPDSRVALLEGFRALFDSVKSDVPAPTAPKPAAAKSAAR